MSGYPPSLSPRFNPIEDSFDPMECPLANTTDTYQTGHQDLTSGYQYAQPHTGFDTGFDNMYFPAPTQHSSLPTQATTTAQFSNMSISPPSTAPYSDPVQQQPQPHAVASTTTTAPATAFDPALMMSMMTQMLSVPYQAPQPVQSPPPAAESAPKTRASLRSGRKSTAMDPPQPLPAPAPPKATKTKRGSSCAAQIEQSDDEDEDDEEDTTNMSKAQLDRKDKLAKKAERARILRRERLDRQASLEKETHTLKTQLLEYELALQQHKFFLTQARDSTIYYQGVVEKYKEKYGPLDGAQDLDQPQQPQSSTTTTTATATAPTTASGANSPQTQELEFPTPTLHLTPGSPASMNDTGLTPNLSAASLALSPPLGSSHQPTTTSTSTSTATGHGTSDLASGDQVGLLGSMSNHRLQNNISLSVFSLIDSTLPTPTPQDPNPASALNSALTTLSHPPQHPPQPGQIVHNPITCPGGNKVRHENKDENVLYLLREQLTQTAHGLLGSIAMMNDVITLREQEKHQQLLHQMAHEKYLQQQQQQQAHEPDGAQ